MGALAFQSGCAQNGDAGQTGMSQESVLSAQDVVWTQLVNVTASGSTLTKTAGQNQVDDAGAVSSQQIASGDGYLELTASETASYRCIGLGHGNTGTTCAEIAFAFRLQGGIAEVREGGVYRTDTTFATGDLLRVSVEAGVVKYYKNGAIVYTSAVAPVYPLLVDTALVDLNATLKSVKLALPAVAPAPLSPYDVVFTSLQNVTATGNALKKTAGINQVDDAGAISSQQIASGDGWMDFTASEPASYRCIGLSHGNPGTTCGEIAFGFRLQGGIAEVRERGVYRADTAFITGDVLKASIETGVVKYYKNATLIYTSTVAPTYPIIVDTSMVDAGATLQAVHIAIPAVTPPAIANATASSTTSTITVNWTTNEPADGQLQWGPTTTYGNWTGIAMPMSRSHSIQIGGLTPGTVYHYKIKTRDIGGNLTVSNDAMIATPTPAGFSQVSATSITDTGATIKWTTDLLSDSQVQYGPSVAYGFWSGINTTNTTAHSMAIGNLIPGTAYHYRLKSRDTSGTLSVSGDFTFTTTGIAPQANGHHRCAWIFTSDANARQTFINNASYYDAVHPNWYALNSDGVTVKALLDADDATFLSVAQQNKVQVIPLIASVDNVAYTRTMLYSAQNRSAHIAQLVNLAVSHNYAGVDLDYEHLWDVADHLPLIAFIQELSVKMHAAGKVVSMAVPALAQTSTVWTYPDLAANLDVAHVMGYDFHTIGTHAGPTAPLGWLDAVNTQLQATGHPEKFILGLPNYGVTSTGACTLSQCASWCITTPATASTHMTSCSIAPYLNANERILNCNTQSDGELYYDDTASLEPKVANAKTHGLSGITYWNIGGEPSGFYQMVRKYY